jgi:hypothetical protein
VTVPAKFSQERHERPENRESGAKSGAPGLRDAENAVYEQHPCEYPMKVYCEHEVLTFAIKKLARSRRIELVHFPYDPDSHPPPHS